MKPIITKTEYVISVSWFSKNCRMKAVAEASKMSDHWFINRVLVQPVEIRSKGIGSFLLQTLIREIKKTDIKRIIVAPGGYAEDLSKQKKFYKENGFVGGNLMTYKGV